MQEVGSVYFIQAASGEIKIGYSSNAAARLHQLQTATAAELRLLGVIKGTATTEAQIHAQFKKHRIRGEWFTPHQELLDFIAQSSKGQPLQSPHRPNPFAQLKDIEPRLGSLEEEIRRHAQHNRITPKYCANAFWYGYPHVMDVFPEFEGFKSTFIRLVGFSAENPRLKTQKAYETAYEFLYGLLPGCKKGCACSTFTHPGEENLIL